MFQTVTTKSDHVKDRCFKTLTLTLTGRGGGQTERNWFVDHRKRRHPSVQSVGTSHLGPLGLHRSGILMDREGSVVRDAFEYLYSIH